MLSHLALWQWLTASISMLSMFHFVDHPKTGEPSHLCNCVSVVVDSDEASKSKIRAKALGYLYSATRKPDEFISYGLHLKLLKTNSDYALLNKYFSTPTTWLWPVVRELGIELVIALIKKQGGKYVNIPDDLIDALRGLQQGDLFEFLVNAKDIAAQFGLPFKIADAVWDTGALGWKALKIIDKFQDMKNKIGAAATKKIWKAINKNFNVLESFDITDWPLGIRLHGKSIHKFWDDMKDAFSIAPSLVETYHSNGRSARRFSSLGIFISYYWSSGKYWTVAINGKLFKFRF